MDTPWWVWKDVLIRWVISSALCPILIGWCIVSVQGNDLGLKGMQLGTKLLVMLKLVSRSSYKLIV